MSQTSVPVERTAAPAATRFTKRRWRDPRLALGLVLIAASVVIGAKLLAGADDTVAVWSLARDVRSGEQLGQGDLVQRRVRFADAQTADLYLLANDDLGERPTLARSLGANELLPKAAVSQEAEQLLLQVPLSVSEGGLPLGLREGTRVDVWVAPADGQADAANAARRHLESAVVLALGGVESALSATGERRVLVGVPETEQHRVAALLGALGRGQVVLTRMS